MELLSVYSDMNGPVQYLNLNLTYAANEYIYIYVYMYYTVRDEVLRSVCLRSATEAADFLRPPWLLWGLQRHDHLHGLQLLRQVKGMS